MIKKIRSVSEDPFNPKDRQISSSLLRLIWARVRRLRGSPTQSRACRRRSPRPKCSRARSVRWWHLNQKLILHFRSSTKLRHYHRHRKLGIMKSKLNRPCVRLINKLMEHRKLKKCKSHIQLKWRQKRQPRKLKKSSKPRMARRSLRKWRLRLQRINSRKLQLSHLREEFRDQRSRPIGKMHPIELCHPQAADQTFFQRIRSQT